ncbi:hypothetical protein PRJ_4486 [Pseudomonas sp. XWY-1]|nr:hypothetical protein PRJ_4486 [Pseudomonas sp. XWY-1]
MVCGGWAAWGRGCSSIIGIAGAGLFAGKPAPTQGRAAL